MVSIFSRGKNLNSLQYISRHSTSDPSSTFPAYHTFACIRSSILISFCLGRMFRLLPVIFTAADCSFTDKPVRMEREVRRMQQVSAYVMAHYVHPIALDDIAAEVGMNRSAFSSWARTYTGRMQIFSEGQRHLAHGVNTLWIFQFCRCRIPRILFKFVPEKRIS